MSGLEFQRWVLGKQKEKPGFGHLRGGNVPLVFRLSLPLRHYHYLVICYQTQHLRVGDVAEKRKAVSDETRLSSLSELLPNACESNSCLGILALTQLRVHSFIADPSDV